jgi:hypothetical protein
MSNVNLEVFRATRGQYISAAWKKIVKPAARFRAVKLEKRTSGIFRAGINFANLGMVVEAIANGERGEVQELPWGEWEKNGFPYFITHNGNRYVRLYPPYRRNADGVLEPCWANAQLRTQYWVNEKLVDVDTFKSYLTPSDAKSMTDDPPPCITVNIANLEVLGENDPERHVA